MDDKIQLYLVREDLEKYLFVKSTKDGTPIGREWKLPYSEWDRMEKFRVAKNLWEITIPEEIKKNFGDIQKRIDWLFHPSKSIPLLRAMAGGNPDIWQLFDLGTIVDEYTKEFGLGIFQLREDAMLLKRLIES